MSRLRSWIACSAGGLALVYALRLCQCRKTVTLLLLLAKYAVRGGPGAALVVCETCGVIVEFACSS